MKIPLITILTIIINCSPLWGAAPSRGTAYVETSLCASTAVFFCEDFQDAATAPTSTHSGGNCIGVWNNPAFVHSSYCWNANDSGGLLTPTITVPGVPSSGNKIYRMGPSMGCCTIDAFLTYQGKGTGYSDYYIRWQTYISSAVQWPDPIQDIKFMLTHPESFLDPPSADYQNGLMTNIDYYCSPTNYSDVLMLRVGTLSQDEPYYPLNGDMCPPLATGAAPDGVHAVRLAKNRWYTFEVHFVLSSNPSVGLIEAWIDGVQYLSLHRATCGSCSPMSYIYFTNYKNSGDSNFDGYIEYDNIVMSTAPIGVPGEEQGPASTVLRRINHL